MPLSASIHGLDTPLGAYLARLLDARGYRVGGTGGRVMLDRLGVGDTVATGPIDDADEVYDVTFGVPTPWTQRVTAGKLCVAVNPGDHATIADLAAARARGQFVATARIWPHESRFGPGTTPVARLVAAIALETQPDPADLASATDCGWTAEYVDPLWRQLQRPVASDVTIATGRLIAGRDVARVAAAWFKRPPSAGTSPAETVAAAGSVGDPAPAAAALGWRAMTVGDDLVETLCEGFASGRA